MTAPIVERSTEQKAASLGWRTDQLERRPTPDPSQLPIAVAERTGITQTVTATTPLRFDEFETNDPNTFDINTVLTDGIIILREGMYEAISEVNYRGADVGVIRSVEWQFVGGVVGGRSAAISNVGQNSAGMDTVNSTPSLITKAQLNGFIVGVSVFTPPTTLKVLLRHNGVNYNVENLPSRLVVVRFGSARNWSSKAGSG